MGTPNSPTVLFLGKSTHPLCRDAAELTQRLFPKAVICLGVRTDPLPEKALAWSGDFILSCLSPWIIPSVLLERAGRALNFHPGPPEYPGTGCTNFAIYDGAKQYGVTCHEMKPKVDTGRVLNVRRFPISPNDSVWDLTQRCYDEIAIQFLEILTRIQNGKALPESDETWTRVPFTRRELDALCRLEPGMPEEEMARRIRATTFPGAPGAYLEVLGKPYSLKGG